MKPSKLYHSTYKTHTHTHTGTHTYQHTQKDTIRERTQSFCHVNMESQSDGSTKNKAHMQHGTHVAVTHTYGSYGMRVYIAHTLHFFGD